MKKLLLLLSIFITAISFGQGIIIPPYNAKVASSVYGVRARYDTFHIQVRNCLCRDSKDSTPELFVYSGDSALYVTYLGNFYKLKGGFSIDTTSLSDRINARVLISDTSPMLRPYVKFSNLDSAVAAGGFLIGPISNSQLQHSAIFFSSTNLIFSGGGTVALGGTMVANADTVNQIASIKRLKDSAAALRAAIGSGGSSSDTTLRGQVIPSLITGILRYTGSNWVFDPTSYATNANLSLKKDISDSTTTEGYTTLYQHNKIRDSLATLIAANTANISSNTTAIGTKVNKADSSNIGVGGYVTPTQLATKQNTITVLPIVNGGTGTVTPSLVAGTNVTITGTFPNQNISAIGGTDTIILAGPFLKSTTVGKTKTLTVDTSLTQTVLMKSSGLIIGTSIDTTYPSANFRVDSFLITKTDSAVGNTVKMQARPGSTILQQESIYLADANKATYDWIDFRLGANDVGDTTTYPTVQSLVDAYQKLVDTVSATKKTSCKILLSAETPALSRYITLYGATIGTKIWTRLSQLNESVMGGTLGGIYTKITGVQYRENYGFKYLDDGNGNLAVPYDTSSLDAGIHPNNAGKKMMAYGLRKALNQMGFLKVTGENPPLPGVLNSIPVYYGPNGYAGNQYLTFNTPSLPYGMNITNPKSTGQSIYYSSNNLGTLGGAGMNGSTALAGTNSYYAGNYSVISQKGLIINAGTANSGGSNSFILFNVDGFGQPLNGLLLTKNNLRLFSNTVSGNSIAVSDTSTASGNNPSYILSSGGDSCIIFQNNLNAAAYKIFSPRSLNVWKPNSGDVNMLSEAGKIQLSGFGASTPQIAITSSTTAKISASLSIVDGTQGANKILISDANGLSSWQSFIKDSVSSASTLTINFNYNRYTFNGTTATWTLPAVTSNKEFHILNKGTANLTVNSNTGGNDIYFGGTSVAFMVLAPGDFYIVNADGTNYQFNH